MSHVEYFDMNAYFNTQQYLNSLSMNLEAGKIGENELTEEEAEILRQATEVANQGSNEGKLDGIVELIEKAEKIFDKYGMASECPHHKQTLQEFLDEISQRPDVVRKYGLEGYVRKRKAQEKPTTKAVAKKKSCGRGGC
ncbi:hypothetical protein HZA97_08870 [Candidatus Woesearchaeota archaeon]|nr:hypothetical protein [Candidatus Woesearchaeota archaeon]